MLTGNCSGLAGRDPREAAGWGPVQRSAILLLLFALCPSVAAAQSPAAGAQDYPLTVSVPVALAQTGLNGTFMSLGCEYSFKPGTHQPQAQYFAVIKNGKGKTAAVAVHLDEQGMAAVFIDGWRPADRPFTGFFAQRIVDPNRPSKPQFRPISAEIDFPLNPNQQ